MGGSCRGSEDTTPQAQIFRLEFLEQVSAQMLVSGLVEPRANPVDDDHRTGFLLGSHGGDLRAERLDRLLSIHLKRNLGLTFGHFETS